MVSRFSLLISAILGAYLALFFHLYSLQVLQGSAYAKQADAQMSGIVLPDRGTIYFTDKYGKPLAVATTKDFPLVYATPRSIEDPLEVGNAVAPALGLPIDEVVQQLKKSNDDYELLKRKASDEVAAAVSNLELPGIYVKSVPERFYPLGSLAAHLLGFVGPDGEGTSVAGRYGIEQLLDDDLGGRPGEMKNGKLIEPTPGKNVQLTIDPNIQIESERVLESAVRIHRASGGSVIVEEPATGKILAMGSLPTFDPNEYQRAAIGDFMNPTIQQIYEPGSVFKIITMAAGIDAGKITPETKFYDPGVLMVSGKKIQNWDHLSHGTVSMTNVIELSLNTGAAFAERQTGNAIFLDYVNKFGFNDKTGIDLPGELKGDLRRLTPKAPAVAYATASFGQGVAVTALQVIQAIAAIANGGVLMRPYVNASDEPHTVRTVIRPETAQSVTKMMISAVDKAKVAKIDGYTLAGKSGTAQVPDFVHGGYSNDVIHTYVGFGPTANPRFIILLELNKPKGDTPENPPLAGSTVVPAFRDLAQFIINYYNIAPDRIKQ